MDKSVLATSQVPQNGASCANRLSRLEDRRFFRFRHFIRLFVFHAEMQFSGDSAPPPLSSTFDAATLRNWDNAVLVKNPSGLHFYFGQWPFPRYVRRPFQFPRLSFLCFFRSQLANDERRRRTQIWWSLRRLIRKRFVDAVIFYLEAPHAQFLWDENADTLDRTGKR